MKIAFIFVFLFGLKSYSATEPVNYSPSECRQYCSDNSGGCLDLNRPPMLIAAGSIFRLVELVQSSQGGLDNACKQTIQIENTHFRFSGPSCTTARFEATLKMPGNTRGQIEYDHDNFLVLSFTQDSSAPMWELAGLEYPSGFNPIKYVTLEKRNGEDRIVWFDGYWCYSVKKN